MAERLWCRQSGILALVIEYLVTADSSAVTPEILISHSAALWHIKEEEEFPQRLGANMEDTLCSVLTILPS